MPTPRAASLGRTAALLPADVMLMTAGAAQVASELPDLTGATSGRWLRIQPQVMSQDPFADPHLAATGGLAPVRLPADASSAGRAVDTHTALLPLSLAGQRLGLRAPTPALGEHGDALLAELGYSAADIGRLRQAGVVGVPPCTAALLARA